MMSIPTHFDDEQGFSDAFLLQGDLPLAPLSPQDWQHLANLFLDDEASLLAAAPDVLYVVIDDSEIETEVDEDMGGGSDSGSDRLLARDGTCFTVIMPDGVSLRFTNALAAMHAFQCYVLDGGHVLARRGDLAAAFSKDGILGCLSGARTQTRRFQQVLAREGLAVHAVAWAGLRQQALDLIASARALAEVMRAMHARV
jgi:hypothetical protein